MYWRVIGHVCHTDSFYSSFQSECLHDESYGRDVGQEVSIMTSIPRARFGEHHFESSIARRMRWAAERRTTRIEDEAYCLLGIFGVNMPLIYGEGQKAFARLLEEILKNSTDHSIFAWSYGHEPGQSRTPTTHFGSLDGVYTTLPAFPKTSKDFRYAGNVFEKRTSKRRPYRLTNLGLKMKVNLVPIQIRHLEHQQVFAVHLNCTSGERWVGDPSHAPGYKLILLKVKDLPNDPSDNLFVRLSLDPDANITAVSADVTERTVYIVT